jgi:hypothetical protein
VQDIHPLPKMSPAEIVTGIIEYWDADSPSFRGEIDEMAGRFTALLSSRVLSFQSYLGCSGDLSIQLPIA